MNPLDLQHMALWWGPGVLVLIAFGWGFFRLAEYWIGKSMEMKRQQMDGAYGLVRQYIEKFLGAQSGQADALARLASCVEHHESQESFEHQEILIGLKALHRDMGGLRCRSDGDSCTLRAAGHGGRCSSSSDALRDTPSPGCEGEDPRQQAAVPEGAGTDSVKRCYKGRNVEGSPNPAVHNTPKTISNLEGVKSHGCDCPS